jgi:hypothetical protein
MPKSEENLKSEKYNREYLDLRVNSERTSQQGRVYRYLKDQGRGAKLELIKKAINAFSKRGCAGGNRNAIAGRYSANWSIDITMYH